MMMAFLNTYKALLNNFLLLLLVVIMWFFNLAPLM